MIPDLQPKVWDRTDRAVCKFCHIVMRDLEPMSSKGEFYHPKGFHAGYTVTCRHAGKTFVGGAPEIVPFQRKRVRRAMKRASSAR